MAHTNDGETPCPCIDARKANFEAQTIPPAPQPEVPVRSWEGRPFNDAWINEITMDALGQWPSFEAQSWACKVVHAAYAAHPPQPSASVAATLLLNDDFAIIKMAEAIHDGPLGADDHWFSAARPQGAWCVEVVRAALRALKGGE